MPQVAVAGAGDIPALESLLGGVWSDWSVRLQRPLKDLIIGTRDVVLTASVNSTLVGCIVLSSGPIYSCLHALAVSPGLRRNGIARALIDASAAMHRNLHSQGYVAAFVLAGSPQIKIFERAGFRQSTYRHTPQGHCFLVLCPGKVLSAQTDFR